MSSLTTLGLSDVILARAVVLLITSEKDDMDKPCLGRFASVNALILLVSGLLVTTYLVSGIVPVKIPARVLNLTNWKLTLPINTAHAGVPDEYTQPQLNTVSIAPYFHVNPAGNGVIFQSAAGGVSTRGSTFPRSELREMTRNGSRPAAWSNTSGIHVMVVDEALTAMTLAKKRQIVTAQIHDPSREIIEIMADKMGTRANADGSLSICVRLDGTEQRRCLNNHYVLGTRYVVKLVATAGHILIYYNGILKFNFVQSGFGWYFKAGCYVQSNTTTKGLDAPAAYGRVTIYGLRVIHM